MKKIQPFFFLFLFSILSTNYHAQVGNELPADNDIDILMILPTGYGPNYFLLRDTFESFGWNVTTAGTGISSTICSQFTAVYNGRVYLDENVANLNAEDFDAVFLVSSEQWIPNPMGNILQSPDAIALFQQFSELDKGISTFCQGIRVFAQANIINGKTVTGPQTYYSDCVNRGATYLTNQNAPVKDGMMVTSRRARTNSVRIPEKLEKALQGN